MCEEVIHVDADCEPGPVPSDRLIVGEGHTLERSERVLEINIVYGRKRTAGGVRDAASLAGGR